MTLCLFPVLAAFIGLDCHPVPALASRYDAGIMAATIEARQTWGHIPADLSNYQTFVAVGDCDRIGEKMIIRDASKPNQDWLLALVVDCAGSEEAREFMRHIAVEVDASTAAAWGFDCHCPWPIEVMEGR